MTRRGRIVALILLLALASGLAALVGAPGQAADPPGANPTTVVRPGESLWSIANRHAPGRDRFATIEEICRLNGIGDYTVHPGQRLILPRRR